MGCISIVAGAVKVVGVGRGGRGDSGASGLAGWVVEIAGLMLGEAQPIVKSSGTIQPDRTRIMSGTLS